MHEPVTRLFSTRVPWPSFFKQMSKWKHDFLCVNRRCLFSGFKWWGIRISRALGVKVFHQNRRLLLYLKSFGGWFVSGTLSNWDEWQWWKWFNWLIHLFQFNRRNLCTEFILIHLFKYSQTLGRRGGGGWSGIWINFLPTDIESALC